MCSNASITKILRINDNNLVILSNEKEKIKGIKYLQIKDWKHNVISFSALDHDGHFVDNIIDEKIDLEKIVELRMQIEELHRALKYSHKRRKRVNGSHLLQRRKSKVNQQKRKSKLSSNQKKEG